MPEKVLLLTLGWIPKLGAWLVGRWRSRLNDMDRYILRSAFFPGDTNANLVQVVNHDFGQFVVAGSKDLSADANPSVVADLVASTKKLARLGYLVRVHSNDPSAADYRLTAKGEKKARRD